MSIRPHRIERAAFENFLLAHHERHTGVVQVQSRPFMLLLDPASFASGCPCPVLAVYGSLDMQVNDGTNAPVMTRALSGKPGSSVEVLVGANHLFQAAVTGGFEEYSTLPRRFVPGLIPLVMDFIQSRD